MKRKINFKKKSRKTPRIAVFIDAGNLWSVYRSIGKKLDLSSLEKFFATKFEGNIFKIFYYVAFPPVGTRPADKIKGFHNFLTYIKKNLKFCVSKKPLKTIFLRDREGNLIHDQETGEPRSIEKGNLDVELAIDALRYSGAYDIAILVTGDSDFLPLVSYLRNLGDSKKVYIFSTEGCISHELKTGGNGYFDISKFPEIHGQALRHESKK